MSKYLIALPFLFPFSSCCHSNVVTLHTNNSWVRDDVTTHFSSLQNTTMRGAPLICGGSYEYSPCQFRGPQQEKTTEKQGRSPPLGWFCLWFGWLVFLPDT